MLPTAQDQAEAQRVLQVQDAEKINAFNNDMITFAQLEAYFTDRLARATNAVDKAQVNSMLTSAKAANKKKASVAAMNAATFALTDFQEGAGTYEDARAAIENAKGSVDEPANVEKLEQMLRGARSIKTAREITNAVNQYNNGGKFTEAHKFLNDRLATETNEQLKTQISQSIVTLRKAENNRVLTQAAAAYNATGDVNAALSALDALRNDPTQTDAEEVTKISAQMETLAVAEQQSLDSKEYIKWQTHQISDEQALAYFQGRLATARNPKEVEYLGKYAANVQQKMDGVLKQAQGRAASVARGASTRATAAVSRQDNLSEMEWKYFEDKVYPDMLREAGVDRTGKTSGAVNIEMAAKANDYRKKVLDGLMRQGGHNAGNYAFLKATADREFRTDVANALYYNYKSVQAENIKELEGKLGNITEFVNRSLDVAETAADLLAGPYSQYFTDAQKKKANGQRNDVLSAVQMRLDSEAAVRRKAESSIGNQIAELYGMLGETEKQKLAQAMGIKPDPDAMRDLGASLGLPGDVAARQAKAAGKLTLEQFSSWLMENPAQRLPAAMNLGIDPEKRKNLLPGQMAEFQEKFLESLDATKRGKILGGDAEFRRNYLAFLKTAYPNSFRTVTAGGLIFDVDTKELLDDMTPDQMRKIRLLETMSEQPFRGAELPAGPSNPDPAKSVVFNEVGEPSGPQWTPASPEQVQQALSLGPLAPVALMAFAIGDNWENIKKWTAQNGEWWAENLDNVLKANVPSTALGPMALGGEYIKDLWEGSSETFASFWQNVVGVRESVEQAFTGFFSEIGELSEAGQEEFRQQEAARRDREAEAVFDFSGGINEFTEFTQQRAGEWFDLAQQRAQEWQEFGAESWGGIQANIQNTWGDIQNLAVGAFNAISPIDIPETVPTWGGWDALTNQAQASIQELIDGWSVPNFQLPNFQLPEIQLPWASAPQPEAPVTMPADTQGDKWWQEEPQSIEQYIPQDYYVAPNENWGLPSREEVGQGPGYQGPY